MTGRDQLTPREIAARTGFSYHAILRAIHRGDLQAFEPVPGRLRVEQAEYDRWRTARPTTPATARTERPEPVTRAGGRPADRSSFDAKLRAIEGGAA